MTKHGEIDYEAIVKLSDGFNCADLRNVCTEAGMYAIRDEREWVVQDDFSKAVRKVIDMKKVFYFSNCYRMRSWRESLIIKRCRMPLFLGE